MRKEDKCREIESYMVELKTFIPDRFEDYSKDVKTKAACERYFEKIISASVYLAFILIKELNLKIPEEDKEAFQILAQESIITQELCDKLKDAKAMRNILSHQYGEVNDEIVFKSISEELLSDVENFIHNIP